MKTKAAQSAWPPRIWNRDQLVNPRECEATFKPEYGEWWSEMKAEQKLERDIKNARPAKGCGVVFLLALLLAVSCGVGCAEPNTAIKSHVWISHNSSLAVVEIDGHEYAVLHAGLSSRMLHHEGCPCKE